MIGQEIVGTQESEVLKILGESFMESDVFLGIL